MSVLFILLTQVGSVPHARGQDGVINCLPIAATIEKSMEKFDSGKAKFKKFAMTVGNKHESDLYILFSGKRYYWFDHINNQSGYVNRDEECVTQFNMFSRMVNGQGDIKAHIYSLTNNQATRHDDTIPLNYFFGMTMHMVEPGDLKPSLATVIRWVKNDDQNRFGKISVINDMPKQMRFQFIPTHKLERYEFLVDKLTGFVLVETCFDNRCPQPVRTITRELGKIPGVDGTLPVKVTYVDRTLSYGPGEQRTISTEYLRIIELLDLELQRPFDENEVNLKGLGFPRGGIVNDHRSGKEYLYLVPEVDNMMVDDALQAFLKEDSAATITYRLLYGVGGAIMLAAMVVLGLRYRKRVLMRRRIL